MHICFIRWWVIWLLGWDWSAGSCGCSGVVFLRVVWEGAGLVYFFVCCRRVLPNRWRWIWGCWCLRRRRCRVVRLGLWVCSLFVRFGWGLHFLWRSFGWSNLSNRNGCATICPGWSWWGNRWVIVSTEGIWHCFVRLWGVGVVDVRRSVWRWRWRLGRYGDSWSSVPVCLCFRLLLCRCFRSLSWWFFLRVVMRTNAGVLSWGGGRGSVPFFFHSRWHRIQAVMLFFCRF